MLHYPSRKLLRFFININPGAQSVHVVVMYQATTCMKYIVIMMRFTNVCLYTKIINNVHIRIYLLLLMFLSLMHVKCLLVTLSLSMCVLYFSWNLDIIHNVSKFLIHVKIQHACESIQRISDVFPH